MLDVHPNRLAPVFLGLGLFGLASLALFLFTARRRAGWAGLVAFSVASLPSLVPGTLLLALSLGCLLAPSVRDRFLGDP